MPCKRQALAETAALRKGVLANRCSVSRQAWQPPTKALALYKRYVLAALPDAVQELCVCELQHWPYGNPAPH